MEQYLPQIKKLLQHYGVEHAYLFRSAARGEMTEDSDVDFIIKFPDTMDYVTYADNYFAPADALEMLIKKPVDLVTEKTLKNPYLIQNINRQKVQII